MKTPILPDLDPIVHAPVRLAVLSILVSVESADFNFLKEAVGATDGNLSTHLSKLEAAGLISIEKTYEGKKPLTRCAMTAKGRKAFLIHLDRLERIISRGKAADGGKRK
jgi:DNA-binding transcriptional ArsR family regulator